MLSWERAKRELWESDERGLTEGWRSELERWQFEAWKMMDGVLTPWAPDRAEITQDDINFTSTIKLQQKTRLPFDKVKPRLIKRFR